MGAVNPASSSPLGSGPLGSGPVGSGPLGNGPLGSSPLDNGPLGSSPIGSAPTGNSRPGREAPAISIRALAYRYPHAQDAALRGIDLDVAPGEFVSVIGDNGAGKTTLASAIRGFVPHFYEGELAGTVTVNGRNLADAHLGDLAREIGYVFQNPFTQITGIAATVYEELAFGLENLGVEPAEIRDRVEEVLERAGIAGFRTRNPFQLSGGQMQRVALASVLVMDQPILVLDEPTSQLDPVATDQVFTLVQEAAGRGTTIVLIEHKMEHVAQFSDRVILLDAGRVALQGPPREVFADPRCAEHGTRLPEPIYIQRALARRGLDVPGAPMTVEELEAGLAGVLGREPDDGESVGDDEVAADDEAAAGEGPITPAGSVDRVHGSSGSSGSSASVAFRAPNGADSAQNATLESGRGSAARRGASTSEAEGPAEPMVELRGVTFSYPNGTLALDGIDLTIARGESVALVGQNGAGKTTAVKLMNGLLKPTTGTVTVAGEPTTDKTAAQVARTVGYVFQNPDDQIFNATVGTEVAYGLKRAKLPADDIERRVADALELTGLADQRETNPYDLPLSVRKFVTIASVIAAQPAVIVLDEPTAGQDLRGLTLLRRILRVLRERGTTLLTISHDMEFVSQNFTRTVVMALRKIVLDGPTAQVFYDQDALARAHVEQPAFVRLADRFTGPETGLSLPRFVEMVQRR